MQFINEQNRLSTISGQAIGGGLQNFPHLADTGGRGIESFETAARLLCDQFRQRRFPGAGRTVKNHGPDPIGIQHAPQQLSIAQNMSLA